MLKEAGIKLLNSAEYRIGGKAAARNILPFRDRAVRTAGARSLSALRIRAESVARVAVSATNVVAMFTSVSFSSYWVQVAPQARQLRSFFWYRPWVIFTKSSQSSRRPARSFKPW